MSETFLACWGLGLPSSPEKGLTPRLFPTAARRAEGPAGHRALRDGPRVSRKVTEGMTAKQRGSGFFLQHFPPNTMNKKAQLTAPSMILKISHRKPHRTIRDVGCPWATGTVSREGTGKSPGSLSPGAGTPILKRGQQNRGRVSSSHGNLGSTPTCLRRDGRLRDTARGAPAAQTTAPALRRAPPNHGTALEHSPGWTWAQRRPRKPDVRC